MHKEQLSLAFELDNLNDLTLSIRTDILQTRKENDKEKRTTRKENDREKETESKKSCVCK